MFIWESVKFKLTRSVSLCIIFSDVSVNVLLDDWWCWRCISVKWWAPQEPLLHFSNSLLWLQVSRSWMLSTVGWLTSDSRNISPCSPRLGMIWTQSPECKYQPEPPQIISMKILLSKYDTADCFLYSLRWISIQCYAFEVIIFAWIMHCY